MFEFFTESLLRMRESFSRDYRCKVHKEVSDFEYQGGIICPLSTLGEIESLGVEYPLCFKIHSIDSPSKFTHCGVKEFTSPEGVVFIPQNILDTLGIKEGSIITLTSCRLSPGSHVQLQPQDPSFLLLSNPKAVLEKTLINYLFLTVNDTIRILHNKKTYIIKITETKPGNAIQILEREVSVDLLDPPGYKELLQNNAEKAEADRLARMNIPIRVLTQIQPYMGNGKRIDGKAHKNQMSIKKFVSTSEFRSLPDNNYTVGSLKFFREFMNKEEPSVEKTTEFPGKPQSLL